VTTQPLISCIMPTANRRHYVPQAIRYFLAQDYPSKELVIVDDGTESAGDLVPDDAQVRYVRLKGKRTLGAKRNECVKLCRGDLIMHWDDDDWMAPHRISYQVEAMLREKAEVCGLRKMLFYEIGTGKVWLYEYPARQRPWLAGGSLLYTKDFWRRSPFPNMQVASDTRFVWNQRLDHAAVLADYDFYVAMIHPGNTSRKSCRGSYWKHWTGDILSLMGPDLGFYRSLSQTGAGERARPSTTTTGGSSSVPPLKNREREMKPSARKEPPTTYSIIMVVHNGLEMTRLSTLRTLRHSAREDARLVVVDNGSTDGTLEWLELLARRGDIDLIRSPQNIGHGPGLELARGQVRSPYIVTLDSDAFPLADDWLSRLRARLVGRVKVAGIMHHRAYIHPSCLMIARETLEEFGLNFLNEKDRPSRLDVAERLSLEIKRLGYEIAGLERTGALRRGSASEPVYLGSEYEGVVYHQWYTTRAQTAPGRPVDDVPREAIESSMRELFEKDQAEAREVTVVMGVRAVAGEPQRLRNAQACLRALNLQDLSRWRYRLVVVEQDSAPQLEATLAPLCDRYIFAYNPGPYNRGWAFNIGAVHGGPSTGALCLIDADFLVQPDFLSVGLRSMHEGGHRALLPYSKVVYLDEASTRRAIEARFNEPSGRLDVKNYQGRVFTTSQGGSMWVEAALFQEVGGYEERFRGWGREDREFWHRLSQAAPIGRLNEQVLHLNHPSPAMTDRWAQANQRLYDQLAAAKTRPARRAIGDLQLYRDEAERASAAPRASARRKRDWENWHRWELTRIEGIVRNEERLDKGTSARHQLARIVTTLGESMLDVGCGPGALWKHLEAYRPRFRWCGADVTGKMLAVAHRLFPEVPLCQTDGASLPVRDAGFDVVLLRHVLEHLPEDCMRRTLAEAMRVAKRAVVVDFYVPPVAAGTRKTARVGENFLETRWTVADIQSPITEAGWSVGRRLNLTGKSEERDEVWILLSPQEALSFNTAGACVAADEPLKISIIMPTFRRPHTIFRTVEMVRAQTYGNWELIIIDNAGDGCYGFDDPRIQVHCHAEQASASYARNQGLRYATGDLVCFFDDDDDMFPHYLERFVAAFRAHPKAKLVRCGMFVTGGRQNFTYATPECCLRRQFAKPKWINKGPGQDQRYFRQLIKTHGWLERTGDIVTLNEVLCRANADARGGLRAGKY
jgi:glycosyltransferase involved in cell wall biosynthesis